MDGIQQINELILRVTGGPAFQAGLRAAGGAATMAGGAISSIVSTLNPLNHLLGTLSFAAAAYQITNLGSQYENTRRLIAGTFATMGAASDFNAGLTLASTTMDQISIAAARLPGEAEDYISVFQAGLPVLLQSMDAPMTEITEFSNHFTGIMSTLGVSSGEAGMMLTRALASGRGGLDQQSMAARRLLPFITAATASYDHRVTSISEFNQLTQEQRQEVLAMTLESEGLASMLKDAGDSWDAQTGAFSSAMSMMTRMATAPLFDGMRSGLGAINSLLMDANGEWTDMAQTVINIGRTLSTEVVTRVNMMVSGVSSAGDAVRGLLAGGGPIAGAGPTEVSGGWREEGGGDPAIAHAAGIMETLSTVAQPIVGVFETLLPILEGMNTIGMALFGALDTLLGPVGLLLEGMGWIATSILDALAPALESLWNGVSSLVTGISDFLNPILRILVIGLIAVVDVVDEYLMPIISAWVDMIGTAIDAIGQFLSYLGDVIGEAVGIDEAEERMRDEHRTGIGATLAGLLESLDAAGEREDATAAAERAAARAATPGARGGAHTNQDFRYSRFDITQRFQEGFDPGRVAVAFADDLGRVGERRLQSSAAPLFSVR